jgi:adenylosuccinate synthase
MPISVVIGGQFGSEGKGKVAHRWAARTGARIAVRVGGPNSGHTVQTESIRTVLRQLPTPAVREGTISVLPPGSYIDVDVLLREVDLVGATPQTLMIDPSAAVVTERERVEENSSGLRERIGSTASGTGAAVARRVRRDGTLVRASEISELKPYLCDTLIAIRQALNEERHIIVEGTQGYGLSVLHGGYGDYATSRDTTAAGALSEVGVSPLDVEQVVLVIRAFPIRVAGNSGPLPGEIDWSTIGALNGNKDTQEFTTVTGRIRRVANFDANIVCRAIAANNPTHIVLNHVDYVADLSSSSGRGTAAAFIAVVEERIGRRVDLIGINPSDVIRRSDVRKWDVSHAMA